MTKIKHRLTNHPLNLFRLRFLLVAGWLALASGAVFAQNMQGVNGINTATSMVVSYFEPLTKLIYGVGAIVGLIGGIKVYQKFSSGDPDTSKTAASWFGACIFLVVAASVLQSFFK